MKISSRIVFLWVLVFVSFTCGCVYSSGGEKIIKVADFPDKPEFQIDVRTRSGDATEKVYVDAGYAWKQTTFFWCPIFNDAGKYVGHTGSDTQYIPLEPIEIKEMASKANVLLPESPQLPFWDAVGGKLVGVVVALLIVLSFVARLFSK